MAINMVISGALSAVQFANDSKIFTFALSAQWILAAPVCIIGVFCFDESLKMLWVCLSVFAMVICPITFFLLRNVDYYQAVALRKVQLAPKKAIESVKNDLDDALNFD